ncbi:patatin-like phospholipase family protein [Desulfohalobium retbaense]|nr:patatin family protein [Desulfohalobium retbaense]
MNTTQAGLVLEGGGLRGVYTSGVLRYFSDLGLCFPYVIGVSMGACNAANFVARQPERNRIVNIRFVKDRRYLSYRRLLLRGELFGMDFIFDTVPNRLVPFAWNRFMASPTRCVTGVTDCRTGEPVFYTQHELNGDYMTVLQASSSLPFVARPVRYQERFLLDGGVSAPIPVHQCQADGYSQQVVVLTQPPGYRKKPFPAPALARWRYPRFPGLVRALAERHERYNACLEALERRERNGEIVVIRPEKPLPAGRVERNKERLYRVYDSGYADAVAAWPKLASYLGLDCDQ